MLPKNDAAWDKNLQFLLILIVGFNIIPHTFSIPPWTTALAALCLVWKALSLTRGLPLPPKYLNWSMVAAGCGCIFVEYGTLMGQTAASAMLVFLASMKLLETNRYRDAMLVIFTSYFLLMAHLLNSQTLLSTIFMGLDVLLITTLMFQAHKKDRRTSVRSFRPAMRMLSLAIPVWIFLFVSFPRFSAGLWNMKPKTDITGGFSQDLTPGAVESLVQSDDPAFRVQFHSNSIPSPEILYWRGGILTHSEGLKWTQANLGGLARERYDAKKPPKSRIDYEVWLEPSYQKWLFVLDYPTRFEASERLQKSGTQRRAGFIYESVQDLSTRSVYTASSSAQAPTYAMAEPDKSVYLQVPEPLDPRIVELANELREKARTSSLATGVPFELRATKLVLDYFDQQKFRYTLQPGSLKGTSGTDQLAEFLFDKKRGFCEHYAAAYSTLMRLMGIPSRVTVGFQGGKINELGSYLLVRNLDAHAWSEIWRPDKNDPTQGNWFRVDPTETIAPLRLALGGEFNRIDASAIASGMSGAEIQRTLESGLKKFGLQLSLAWDAAQMQWNGFLLRFDFDYQRSILNRLGFQDVTRTVFFVWTVLGIIVFVICLHLVLRKKARREDPLLVAWHKFGAALDNIGVGREPNEGPMSYAERASAACPELADRIRSIVAEFIELRYGVASVARPANRSQAARINKFKREVRRFRRQSLIAQRS